MHYIYTHNSKKYKNQFSFIIPLLFVVALLNVNFKIKYAQINNKKFNKHLLKSLTL